MKSVIAIIDKLLEDFHEKKDHGSEELNDHVVLGIDVDPQGNPCGKVIKIQGRTINVLGMLALLEDQIAEVKKKVKSKFDEIETRKALYESLPEDTAKRLQDLEESLKERMRKGDFPTAEEIEDLKNEARKLFDEEANNDIDSSSSKKDSSGFDINDFKSGF